MEMVRKGTEEGSGCDGMKEERRDERGMEGGEVEKRGAEGSEPHLAVAGQRAATADGIALTLVELMIRPASSIL